LILKKQIRYNFGDELPGILLHGTGINTFKSAVKISIHIQRPQPFGSE
jgi:hypothetical protein